MEYNVMFLFFSPQDNRLYFHIGTHLRTSDVCVEKSSYFMLECTHPCRTLELGIKMLMLNEPDLCGGAASYLSDSGVCVCPQTARYSALIVGIIYGKRRYG